MSLSYHDVMAADLSPLSAVSEVWRKMGERFGELKSAYEQQVQGALANGNWQGQAFGAHQIRARATAVEYAAAKTEALAVAGLLKQAHAELTRLQKAVKDLVTDAETKDYKVDSSGKATYIGFDKLSAKDQATLRHDPDYPALQAQAARGAREWTDSLAAAVKAVDEADQGVQRALSRASSAASLDSTGVGGFNAHAESDLAKAGAPEAAKSGTTTDGWTGGGTITATGPGGGFSTSGPGYGKEGTAKAYFDLFHLTEKGSASNGSVKLSGVVDANAGAKANASVGITEKGISGSTEASLAARGLAEERVGAGPVSFYGRESLFAGGEAGVNAKATREEFTVGGKAFAGGKAAFATGREFAGISIGASGEGWVGPGAEAWWGYKKDKDTGVWTIGGHMGASPIVGLGTGFEITVDPDKVAKSVGDAADAIGHATSSVKKTVSSWF
ncbi:hypothetical protein ACH427_15295 [Streptomyces sp. NPDC020379]|uniref:hypothetical protein n=1 Tax=Streptomyces sp. NPDC020379 TaxID=3365071 RepID=UPI0037B2CC9C